MENREIAKAPTTYIMGPSTKEKSVEAPPQYSTYNSEAESNNQHKPIVIPQSTNLFFIKTFSPFARCYSPALAELQNPIPETEFLAFIDRLNAVFLSLPVFQAAHIAGGALMGTQVLPAQAVGGVLQVTSVLASAGTSFIRVRKFMKMANAEIFNPRGLYMKIQTTKVMMESVGFAETDQKGKLVLPPLDTVVDLETYSPAPTPNGIDDKSAAAAISPLKDPRLLRLQALEGYIAPLTFEVPEPPPESAFSKYTQAPLRWVNKKQSNHLAKAEAKYHKRRESKAEAVAAETSKFDVEINDIDRQIEMLQLESVGCIEGVWGKQDEIEALNMRKQEEMDKRDVKVKEMYKDIDKKMGKVYKKEEKITNRILWIVIDKLNGSETE